MSSKNSSIGVNDPTTSAHYSNLESKDTFLSGKSKCVIVALVVGGVAGVVIVVLGGMNIFGAVGSIGFIASMAGGGALVCIAIGGVGSIAIVKCKGQKQVLRPSTPNTPPIIRKEDISITDASDPTIPTSPEGKPVSSQVKAKNTPIVSPQSDEKRKYYNEQRDHFRAVAKERIERKPVASVDLPDCNGEGFEVNAKEAIGHFYQQMSSASPIQTFGGGEHVCVASDKIPGILFKQKRGSSVNMALYVQRADKARKICEDNGLYLLYVPKCKVVDFKKSVVMEEKAELLEGGWESQRACYQWAVHDPQLQPYIKELFRQLTIFICLMKLADTKYDNVPLTKDGRVALFDLDERGAVTGLTSGLANGKDGLFNMIPLEWFDEFIAIARQHLKAEDFDKLQERLPKLREQAQKRHARTEKIGRFYNAQNITLPTQLLVFDEKRFKNYKPAVALFAKKAVQHFNQQISSLPHLSMVVGRNISIATNLGDEFFKAIVEDPILSSKGIWHEEFKEIKQEGLKALQEQGYILSYKVSQHYPFFSVVC